LWISSYKIEKNILPPDWVIDKLRENYLDLKRKLIKLYGNKIKIYHEFSMHSEAAYFFLEDTKTSNIYKLSFRSHDNFGQHPYDEEILLYQFNTWEECEQHFFKEHFIRIGNQFNLNLTLIKLP